MSITVYVTGRMAATGNEAKVKRLLEKAKNVKNAWGTKAFELNGEEIVFRKDELNGFAPGEDGIENPLRKITLLARVIGVDLNGSFTVNSSCSDHYNNVTFNIVDSTLAYAKTELLKASDEELIAELKSRGYLIAKLKTA